MAKKPQKARKRAAAPQKRDEMLIALAALLENSSFCEDLRSSLRLPAPQFEKFPSALAQFVKAPDDALPDANKTPRALGVSAEDLSRLFSPIVHIVGTQEFHDDPDAVPQLVAEKLRLPRRETQRLKELLGARIVSPDSAKSIIAPKFRKALLGNYLPVWEHLIGDIALNVAPVAGERDDWLRIVPVMNIRVVLRGREGESSVQFQADAKDLDSLVSALGKLRGRLDSVSALLSKSSNVSDLSEPAVPGSRKGETKRT